MVEIRSNKTEAELGKWFLKQGFTHLHFEKKSEIISTYWLDHPVTFKLTKREGFNTYYKEAFGGSLVVFEVALQDQKVVYEGYSPMLLFGIWSKKMSFKKEATGLFKYRKEGYEWGEQLKQYLDNF